MKTPRYLNVLVGVVLALWLVFAAGPFVWNILTSIKSTRDGFAMPPVWTFAPHFDAYRQLWTEDHFGDYLYNSLFVALFTVFISLAIGALSGYALARYSRVGGFYLLLAALLFRALPRMVFVLPYYYFAQWTGLYDTRVLLILVLVTINQPFTIWMFRGFFMDIPTSVDEAAMVDGCNRFQAFRHAILPLALPGAITAAIFTLLLAYNEFMIPVILTASKATTLPVAISQFGSEDLRNWTLSAAGSVSIALPIIAIVMFLQRYFVRGLTSGAVKG